jgi:hypothetical protein
MQELKEVAVGARWPVNNQAGSIAKQNPTSSSKLSILNTFHLLHCT